jgi:hypothetical protein
VILHTHEDHHTALRRLDPVVHNPESVGNTESGDLIAD